jgi:hypothetical protein
LNVPFAEVLALLYCNTGIGHGYSLLCSVLALAEYKMVTAKKLFRTSV